MNNNVLSYLCDIFSLGAIQSKPQRMQVGWTNETWLVHTQTGYYACKKMLGDHSLAQKKSEAIITQLIAKAYQKRGVGAAVAFYQGDEPFVQIDETIWMVFHWVGKPHQHHLKYTESHCKIMGEILAIMHTSHIKLPAGEVWHYQFDADTWKSLQRKAQSQRFIHIDLLNVLLPEVLISCAHYETCFEEAHQHIVISHRDMDRTNVVWLDDHRPVVIDWDSAGKIDAGVECLFSALAFSFEGYSIQLNKVAVFLTHYFAHVEIPCASFDVVLTQVLGNWFNWIQDQLDIALDSQSSKAMIVKAAEEVFFTLKAFESVKNQRKELQIIWEKTACHQ